MACLACAAFRIAVLIAVCMPGMCPAARAQEVSAEDSLPQLSLTKVYLDLPEYLHEYIKGEIPWVNYVRDRYLADVHLLLTQETTGSGGTMYTLTFIGEKRFAAVDDTLSFSMEASSTEETMRGTLVRLLKRGLMRYVEETRIADDLTISYKRQEAAAAVKDRWDYWVFTLNSNCNFNGEKSYDYFYIYSSVSADRVTPTLKIRLSVGTSYNETNYDLNYGTEMQTITSITRSRSFSSFAAWSLGEHWSLGGYGNFYGSTYDNIDFLGSAGPALEYNFYHYSECTRRELRLVYEVYYRHSRYIEETIYDRLREDRVREELSATYEVKERWGSIETTLSGSHYLHDIKKNRLMLYSTLSLRLFEGLSLTFTGYVYMIHDLLSLPKGGASEEEVLTRRKQLDTQYQYFGYIGLRYSFGSIYNNVVNPRFGN